jgi:hypothetical protein
MLFPVVIQQFPTKGAHFDVCGSGTAKTLDNQFDSTSGPWKSSIRWETQAVHWLSAPMGTESASKATLFSQAFAPLACIARPAAACLCACFWWQLWHRSKSLAFADFPPDTTFDLNIVNDVVWCLPLCCKPCCQLTHPNRETASL